MVNGSCHSSVTPLLHQPSAAVYAQTCCCCPQWQWWKRWSDLSETISIGLDVFSLSSCPHCSVRFQECLQCLLRGNEELVLVGRSQKLIFLSFPPSLSFLFFFHSPLLCVSGFGFRQKQCSTVGDALDMVASGSTWEELGPRSLHSFYSEWEDVLRWEDSKKGRRKGE